MASSKRWVLWYLGIAINKTLIVDRETEMIGNALLPVLLSIAAADSSSPDSIDRMRDVEAEVISNLTKADRQALRSSNIPAFDVDVSEFQSLRVRLALCIPGGLCYLTASLRLA